MCVWEGTSNLLTNCLPIGHSACVSHVTPANLRHLKFIKKKNLEHIVEEVRRISTDFNFTPELTLCGILMYFRCSKR